MAVVGFSLTKISAQKHRVAAKGIKIKNDVNILDAKEVGLALGKDKQSTIRFSFSWKTSYTPGLAEIELEGEILYMQDAKKLKDVMAHWKKEKSLPVDIASVIMNPIVNKCSIQAINIASDLNIPSPIPLPKVTAKK
jgi:hypothetical protein